MKHAILWLAIFVLGIQTVAFAIPPREISYQGTITVGEYKAPDGDYELTFRIYGVPVGGAALFTETLTVGVVSGVFDVILGQTVALDPSIFANDLYLSIEIDGGGELAPRTKLTAAAYALVASDVAQGAAVKSINGETDDVDIVGGAGIEVTEGLGEVTIAALISDVTSALSVFSFVLTGETGPAQDVAVVTIDAPGPGSVIVQASGYAHFWGTTGQNSIAYQIDQSAGGNWVNGVTQVVGVTPANTNDYFIPVLAQKVFTTNGGAETYRLKAYDFSNSGEKAFRNTQITATYIP